MDSKRIREHRRCPEYADIFPTDQVIISGIKLRRGLFRSDGLDRIYPELQTPVLATAKITGRNGLVTTGGEGEGLRPPDGLTADGT